MTRALIIAAFLTLWACGPQPPAAGLVVDVDAVAGSTRWTLDQVSPKEAVRGVISRLRFHSTRTAPGLISPLLPENTSSVHCSFNVSGQRPGTKIAVHWRRAGQTLARNNLVTARNTRTLSAQLASDSPLGPGTYEVDVRIGGRVEASGRFRIAGDAAPERPTSQEPRIFDVTLAASNEECIPEPTPRPRPLTTFNAGVSAVQVCLQYENIRQGQRLEVRWFRSSSSSQPLAVTTYSPTGDGELSASYSHDGGIPSGSYHVAVTLDPSSKSYR